MAKQFVRSYEMPARDLYEAARHCVKALGHRVEADDEVECVLNFSTGITHRSWGERMTLRVLPEGYGARVQIEGKGSFPQLIDWGAKRKVAEAFFAKLQPLLDALEHEKALEWQEEQARAGKAQKALQRSLSRMALGKAIDTKLVPAVEQARLKLEITKGAIGTHLDWSSPAGSGAAVAFTQAFQVQAETAAVAFDEAAQQLVEMLELLAKREFADSDERAHRSTPERVFAGGAYGVTVAGKGFPGLLSGYAAAYCGWMPAEALELPKRAEHVGPQPLLAGVSIDDAAAVKSTVDGWGYAAKVTEATTIPIVAGGFRREAIPERVRHEVWRRDQGRCVDCGSRERLHFDHIVPVSKGGSNTVRNIELRCELHNLRKGAEI